MAQPDWHDIAERHKLSAEERQQFFMSANTLAMALSGNITPTIAKGADALMDLPVPGYPGRTEHSFAHVYQETEGKVRAALDDLLAAYKVWLKLN